MTTNNRHILLLAKHLQITRQEAKQLISNGDYTIYTDSEANEAAREYILDSVWAFKASFIIQHSSALDFDEASEQIVEAIQAQCENGNAAMLKLIDDIDDFVESAISADGRGHFLSFYDGEEIELFDSKSNEYVYAYRNN